MNEGGKCQTHKNMAENLFSEYTNLYDFQWCRIQTLGLLHNLAFYCIVDLCPHNLIAHDIVLNF